MEKKNESKLCPKVRRMNIIIKNHVEEACQAQNGTLVVNFCCLENGNGSS